MPGGRARFEGRAAARGLDVEIHTYPEGTRTAEDAAAAVGCEVSQIVKSLVFVATIDGRELPVVALTAGHNRVDPGALARAAGASAVRMAGADEVRAATGYAIGGSPPFGHDRELPTFMDPSLLEHDTVWASAGTPRDVFPCAPAQLRELTDATVSAFAS